MERNKDILMKLAIFIILIVYTAAATCGDGIKAGTEQSNRFQRLTFTFAMQRSISSSPKLSPIAS